MTLATGLLGAGIGLWNSFSHYLVRHEMDEYDHYFDVMMIFFGAMIGLAVGAFSVGLNVSKRVWLVSWVATAGVAAVIPFLFQTSTVDHSREAVGTLSTLAFLAIHVTSFLVRKSRLKRFRHTVS